MIIKSDTPIREFEFWSGAKDTVKYLTLEELDSVESILDDLYPEGISETDLNDFFWFDNNTIAEWLGYNDFDELIESRS